MIQMRIAAVTLCVYASACSDHPCRPSLCDIREHTCQRDIMQATACFRGVEPAEVDVKVVDAEEYAADRSREVPQEDRAEWTRRARAYALLGLHPTEVDYDDALDASLATVGAFYDPDDNAITILHRGEALDSRPYVVTLVHELSHALQGLSELGEEPETLDGWAARSAIVEGDAVLTQDRTMLSLFDVDFDEVPWPRVFDHWQGVARQEYGVTPFKVMLAHRYFVYAFGAQWVSDHYHRGGRDAVDALLAEPPQSTRQVLAGSDFAFEDDWLLPLLTDGKPELEPAYELLGASQRGSWVFEGFISELSGRPLDSLPLDGRELRGDMLTLWANAQTDAPLAVWRLHFSTVQAARALVELADRERVGSGVITARRDEQVVVLIASESLRTAAELGELSWGAVPEPDEDEDEGESAGAGPLPCWLHPDTVVPPRLATGE